MTVHQIEQVTPRIENTCTNQTPRTWEHPKIRLHCSVQSTPPPIPQLLPSHHFKTTRVRVTTPSDKQSNKVSPALNATPVTHPTIPKPLRFRIAGTNPEHNTVCRQLFINVTPSKRPRHATPVLRVSCGRQRTQPSSDSTRNLIVDSLDVHIQQAHDNLHIFRNGLFTKQIDTSFQTVLNEGLLFDVSCRYGKLLVLRPHAHPSNQRSVEFAIVVPDKMLSERSEEANYINYSRQTIYVPYPWHAQVVNGFNSCSTRILIAAYSLEIFRREHLASLESLEINAALDNLPVAEVSAQEAERPLLGPGCRFAALSPHSITANLSVFVDIYEHSCQLAVIRDDVGEIAVLVAKNAVLESSSRKFILNDVSILPYRMSSSVILQALGDKVDKQLHHRLSPSGDEKSYLAFRHEESFEQRSS